jgi:hypothetical protein
VSPEEWETTSDVQRMALAIPGRIERRKARLFGAAMCRELWPLLPELSRGVVADSELLADGQLAVADTVLCSRANDAVPAFNPELIPDRHRDATQAVCYAVLDGEMLVAAHTVRKLWPDSVRPQVILRDLFDHHFRPPPRLDGRRSDQIITLAEAAYSERILPTGHLDLARLAVLSDALEEAGCDDPGLLSHLRSSGPHVRGCWALDAILSR